MIIKIKSEFLDTNNFKSFFMASWPYFLRYVKIPQVYEAGCLAAKSWAADDTTTWFSYSTKQADK